MRIACTILALALLLSTQISAQSETSYDVEHECICLIDSIAADTIIQFWRFTQSNNPGEYNVDVTFDFTGAYTPTGEVLSCKDYYLGDNPGGSGTAGTLTIWTGVSSLGNSNVTESSQILSSAFTGAFKPPAGTTAQQPAGSPGYLRFNTTQSGFEGYNGSAYRFLPWADAPFWTTGYVPFSNGAAITTNSAGRYVWDNTAFELELNGDIQFNDNDLKGLFWKTNNIQLKRNGNNLEFVNNTANTRNFVIKNQSTAKFTFVPESPTGVGSSYLEFSQSHIRMGNSGYISFANNITSGITMGQTSTNIVRVKSLTQLNDRSVEFADSLNVATLSVGLSGTAATKRVGVKLSAGAATTDFDVNGKIRIRDLPDSLYIYELRANSDGRIVRQIGAFVGTINTTTDGSGDVTIAHGMGVTPTHVQVEVTGTTPWTTSRVSADATNFTIRFYLAGVPVASGAVTATWLAKT